MHLDVFVGNNEVVNEGTKFLNVGMHKVCIINKKKRQPLGNLLFIGDGRRITFGFPF